ncbi:TadE family protein [Phycicoccus flavus]|uniref:TadE family protein n=1 Tax=Phycicoccus flavus TaxID=2502783 RepID=UPI000FEBC8A6|nr:TadE family protein [Phycicoccus flavus]NHA68227.1 pilus assembly protein [Phycicoccus flavus]
MTPTRTRRTSVAGERGSAALEAAVGVPAFLLLVGLVIAGGRLAIAGQALQSAATDAARAASIARTQTTALTSAATAATTSLDNQHLACVSRAVTVDVSGFTAPVGTPAAATATVTCTVRLSDLAVPGLPGARTLTATATSPIDTYRERQ